MAIENFDPALVEAIHLRFASAPRTIRGVHGQEVHVSEYQLFDYEQYPHLSKDQKQRLIPFWHRLEELHDSQKFRPIYLAALAVNKQRLEENPGLFDNGRYLREFSFQNAANDVVNMYDEEEPIKKVFSSGINQTASLLRAGINGNIEIRDRETFTHHHQPPLEIEGEKFDVLTICPGIGFALQMFVLAQHVFAMDVAQPPQGN